MDKKQYIAVVGASNFDIYATSAEQLLEADSNPGHVFTTPGGVGRNIAENLARLGCDTRMLTVMGTDAFGDAIAKNAAEAGLDLSCALRLPCLSTSVYVCINKPDGDIAVAISDMDSSREITPDYLTDNSEVLQDAQLVVADANLSQAALLHLWQRYCNKLCIDSVSTPKSRKLMPVLKGLHCLKANRAEAAAISGLPVSNADEACTAAKKLHKSGIRNVIITLGEYGALLSNGEEALHMPLMPGKTINTSGCGDAFFAGALYAMCRNEDLRTTLRSGLAMARICAAATSAVSPIVSPLALSRTIQTFQGGAWL